MADNDGDSVVRAFREETNDLVVVPAESVDEAAAAENLGAVTPSAVVGASPSAAPSARVLREALGMPDGLGALSSGFTAREPSRGTPDEARLTVALVSREGEHASVGVYEDRYVGSDDCRRLRHRVTVPSDTSIAAIAESTARAHLDRFGVRDGATCVELEVRGDDVHLLSITPGVLAPAPSTDASFRAFGHSHEHLLAESILRPREFERRLVRPLQPGMTTLAVMIVRVPGGDEVIRGASALRSIRRLTGFYSIDTVANGTDADAGTNVMVNFVHTDRASVVNSLTIIAEMEDAGILFTEGYQLIGLAPTAS